MKVVEKPKLQDLVEPSYTRREVMEFFGFSRHKLNKYIGSLELYPLSTINAFIASWKREFEVPVSSPPPEIKQINQGEIKSFIRERMKVHISRVKEGMK